MTQKPRKDDFGELKSKSFLRIPMDPPHPPPPQNLAPPALAISLRNRSVCILNPRLIRVANSFEGNEKATYSFETTKVPQRDPKRYTVFMAAPN